MWLPHTGQGCAHDAHGCWEAGLSTAGPYTSPPTHTHTHTHHTHTHTHTPHHLRTSAICPLSRSKTTRQVFPHSSLYVKLTSLQASKHRLLLGYSYPRTGTQDYGSRQSMIPLTAHCNRQKQTQPSNSRSARRLSCQNNAQLPLPPPQCAPKLPHFSPPPATAGRNSAKPHTSPLATLPTLTS